MGMSEYAISRALWFACTKGGRTIYYFPTENDVAEFSRDRFAPAIRDSPYLASQVKETDICPLGQFICIVLDPSPSRLGCLPTAGKIILNQRTCESTPMCFI